MTKAEINSHLDRLFSQEIGIHVYVSLKNDPSHKAKKLDIERSSLDSLLDLFKKSVRSKIIENEELSVLPLSSSDDRNEALYEYDLEIPEELKMLNQILTTDDLEKYNYKKDLFSSIHALIIEIGNEENQIVLYKKIAPINLFGRKNFFMKIKSDERFEKIEEEFVRIDAGFQVIQIKDIVYVLDLVMIEKFLGFHAVIKREAERSLAKIEALDLLENPETLEELISEDISFARKLSKLSKNSPVMTQEISNEEIIQFVKTEPFLKGKIRCNSDESKLQLDTKVSKKLFLKLLNDDFLLSKLTGLHYESLAKNGVETDNSALAKVISA